MTDAEWAVVREAVLVPDWLEGRGGQPEGYCHRQLVDAVRYLVVGGIAWRAVPADFPARDRVCAFFRRWWDKGLVAEFHTTGCGIGSASPPGGIRSRPRASSTPTR
ncbi:transposase [Kitasatospora griseola]|uniref:transposase n=1 Tax=Kitasatospora griseola TaxID=2064 RepID=UPI0036D7D9C3